MTEPLLPFPRFDLPDDWSPDGTMCVLFTIPADQQYLSQIIGLVDMLKWSRNFQRDTTESGAATVSRTWQRALDSGPVVIDEDCNMVRFRVNGCSLEWLDPCDDSWKPIISGGDDTGYTPGYDDPNEPPFVDGYVEDSDGACVAAANFAEAMRSVCERIDFGLTSGDIITVITVDVWLFFARIIPSAARRIIGGLVSAVGGFSAETFHNDFVDFNWGNLRDVAVCYYDERGVMTQAAFTQFMAEMDSRVPLSSIWNILDLICSWGGPAGMTNAATFAGIRSATCAPCADECDLDMDFTETDGSFEAVPPGFDPSHDYGEYFAGQGWGQTFDPDQGYACNINRIHLLPVGCTVTRIEIDVDWQNDYYPFFKLYDPSTGYVYIDEYNAGHGTGLYTYVWTGSHEGRDFGIFTRNTNSGAPQNYIKAIRITGA